MSIKLINYPSPITLAEYDKLKGKLLKELLGDKTILSVYQMGSVREPGISDLDLICVFKNDSENLLDYRKNLSSDEKMILTHGLFGVEEKDLSDAIPYNLLSNLQLLGGKDLRLNGVKPTTDQNLKTQIAIEYLLKMFIALDTQIKLKIVKLRSFLLLGKAISFDLDLLNISEGKLYDLVQKVFSYRAKWYNDQPSKAELKNLIIAFHDELELLLEHLFKEERFYLPGKEVKLPGNFAIIKGSCFHHIHKGIVLPNELKFLGRKYINLQYRLNRFQYLIPYDLPKDKSVIKERFEYTQYLVNKNRNNYPSFLPIMSSLSIY